MLALMVRADEVMSSWRVSAHLYDVNEDGHRTLIATRESWLSEWPEDASADALTSTVRTILRWAVLTMREGS